MRTENFNHKPGTQDIPREIKPLFARVAGEIVGYNREVMDIYGDGPEDRSIFKNLELRQSELDSSYKIIAKSVNGVSGAGNEFMLEGCIKAVEEAGFAPFQFVYDNDEPSDGILVGEFNFEPITKRQEKYVKNELGE